MSQIIFDAGIFIFMLIISFTCVAFYKKIGALMLVVPIISFLLGGLVIVTGEDVAFYQQSNPSNMTITVKNDSSGVTTTTIYHGITPSNQTQYVVGNGQFPISGVGQLWMGYSLILLALIFGVIFVDQTVKGNLIKGD